MAPTSTDRQKFLNEQLESVQKALTKQEVPLKQKHARRIILGTHQDKNCSVFWADVIRMQLEKNALVTWKFCHLLHMLIRDGHESVLAESHDHLRRIILLGDFWKVHTHSSSHGAVNEQYCKMLCSRLQFHKKHPQIIGNLCLVPQSILLSLRTTYHAFEIYIDILDQMESLLQLQKKVFDFLDLPAREHSLTPQGQGLWLFAPLKLVILDVAKLYDIVVKGLFLLHKEHPHDVLEGHRDRFKVIFEQTKSFYDSCKVEYFKYLVSIPILPDNPPNFLLASEIDKYQSPQAIEIEDGKDGDETAPENEKQLMREDSFRPPTLQSPTNPQYQRIEDPPPPPPPPRMRAPAPLHKPLPPPKPLPRTSLEKPKCENLHTDLLARAEKAEKELEVMTARYNDLEIKYQRALNLLVSRERSETGASLMHTVRDDNLSVIYELPPLDD